MINQIIILFIISLKLYVYISTNKVELHKNTFFSFSNQLSIERDHDFNSSITQITWA